MPKIDLKLYRKARKGDRKAFRKFVQPYRGLIYSVAFGMHKDRNLARQHTLDVMRIAFRSLSKLCDPDNLPRWLYALTFRHVQEQMGVAGFENHAPVKNPGDEKKAACFVRIERAWGRLPQRLRVMMGMKYMNQYSCREIAEVLGESVDMVKARLFEARKILRWPVLRYIHHGPDQGGKTEGRRRVDWVELTKRWVAPPTREEETVVRRLCALSLGPRPTAAAA